MYNFIYRLPVEFNTNNVYNICFILYDQLACFGLLIAFILLMFEYHQQNAHQTWAMLYLLIFILEIIPLFKLYLNFS